LPNSGGLKGKGFRGGRPARQRALPLIFPNTD
jgi:hypothetical protein